MQGAPKDVAVVALDGLLPFELSVPWCGLSGSDRTDEGLPGYEFAVVAGEPGPIRSEVGFTVGSCAGLDRLLSADLVVVPALSDERRVRGQLALSRCWPSCARPSPGAGGC